VADGEQDSEAGRAATLFDAEVARVRASGALGEAGRLRELFDYLASRGLSAAPATQADIADMVFGQPDSAGDDATARVYVHRLRKRLEDFYSAEGEGADGARLNLPAGIYALRLASKPVAAVQSSSPAPGPSINGNGRWRLPLAVVGAIGLTFIVARVLGSTGGAAPANDFWRPFLESERPVVVVVGDYYMFGEIDPVRPEQSRLIRDYRIDSPTDLAAMQEAEPDRYGNAEDVGLSYLPLSTAYALRHVMPILGRPDQAVRIVPASEFEADSAREANIVYIGLISGLGLLEDTTFTDSTIAVGESYDELIDTVARRVYTSEEARRLASPVFYRDYGYVARFRSPGGTLVAVVAGARDTALRGLGSLLAQHDLPDEMRALAKEDRGFEAVFQITGQQGADLSARSILARARP